MLPEPLTPETLEQLRRSVVILTPRHPAALNREDALALMEKLQSLQGADRRLNELVEALRAFCGRLRRGQASKAPDRSRSRSGSGPREPLQTGVRMPMMTLRAKQRALA